MNKMLKNTHRKENIDLLRVRDYYFDKARNLNKLKTLLVYFPAVLLVVSYFSWLPYYDWLDENRDYIINTITIASFIVIHFVLDRFIGDFLDISNAYREKYDVKVFGLEENPFAYAMNGDEDYTDKARLYPSAPKYETWYGEIFDDNNSRNIICAQLDNIIYTYYVYRHYRKFKIITFGLIIGFMAAFSFVFANGALVLGLMSVFNIAQTFIEEKSEIDGLIESNYGIMELVRKDSARIAAELDSGNTSILRTLQDTIINNRNNSIFISKFARNLYLKDSNIYYKKLDEYKAVFFKEEHTDIPSSAEDIEIFNFAETETITLAEIQQRLLSMMGKLADAFEREGIVYTLDGGSLIGAVRAEGSEVVHLTGGKFVFWDDDIDIAIPLTDGMLEKAKEAVRKHLGDEFDVQDYDNDPYYSPRLSNFRIRDRRSVISEKDSPLFDKYRYRGLFIDVYAYTPVLHSVTVDKLFRRVMIHPLYKRILKTEKRYPVYAPSNAPKDKAALKKILNKFARQKAVYMKRVDWYLSHAKNDSVFVYTPNYIDNLKKAGPYIRKEDLYGEKKSAQFETLELPVPTNSDKVLAAFYGKWYVSPYIPMEKLKAEHGERWFSCHEFKATIMKHIDHVDIEK